MKRLTRKARRRKIRICKKRARRAKKKRRKLRKASLELQDYFQLKAPEIFTLSETNSREKLLHFIGRFRKACAVKKRWIFIDFSMTRRMLADGTLLFFAELSRLRQVTKSFRLRFRCNRPRNTKVAQVLQQVGIFKLLGYRKSIQTTFPDVIHWRSASGSEVNGEKYEPVLGHYDGLIADALRKKLFGGVTEAMTNCRHHAYLDIRPDGLNINLEKEPKEWWMFTQEKDERLTVVFCDLGIGIPGSLPRKQPKLWNLVKQSFVRDLDAHAIQEAIKHSKTSTGLHYRGKGLKQLIDVVSSSEDGRVRIYSNKGCFTLKSGKEEIAQFEDNILGTLIYWSIPIGDLKDDTIKN